MNGKSSQILRLNQCEHGETMTHMLPASPMMSSVARVSQGRTSTTGQAGVDDMTVCKGKVRFRVEGGWYAGSSGERRTVHESGFE